MSKGIIAFIVSFLLIVFLAIATASPASAKPEGFARLIDVRMCEDLLGWLVLSPEGDTMLSPEEIRKDELFAGMLLDFALEQEIYYVLQLVNGKPDCKLAEDILDG